MVFSLTKNERDVEIFVNYVNTLANMYGMIATSYCNTKNLESNMFKSNKKIMRKDPLNMCFEFQESIKNWMLGINNLAFNKKHCDSCTDSR